jgi:hypothetical protein
MLFRTVDPYRQTSEERHREIHRQTKCRRWCPVCRKTAKYELRGTIVFSSHSSEPMVDQRRFSDSAPGNNCNNIDLLVRPCIVQESDILLSAKTSLPVTGNLATEIFFGASLPGGLRIPTRESASSVFCRL